MSLLSTPAARQAADDRAAESGRHPVVTAAVSALQVAVTGLLAAASIAVLVWIVTPKVSTGWPESVRIGVDVWAVAHGATLVLAGGDVDLAPLALVALTVWLAWGGACRVRDALVRHRASQGQTLLVGAVFTATYAALGVAAAALAGSTTARAPLGSVAAACALVALTGLLIATFPLWRSAVPAAGRIDFVIRAAGVALLGWFGASTIALVGALAFGWSRIVAVQEALQPGVSGHILLVLLQLLLLPTALVWAAAYVAGPGFSVGSGTTVSLGNTELGPLPALPLFGALPHPVEHPVLMWCVPLLVVLAGAAAGYWLVTRGDHPSRGRQLADAVLTAVVVAVIALVLSLLAAGSLGGGRMSSLGPQAALVALVVFAEVLVGAVIGVLAGPPLASGRAGQLARRVLHRAGRATINGAGAAGQRATGLSRQAAGQVRARASDRFGRTKAGDAGRRLRGPINRLRGRAQHPRGRD